MPTNVKWKIKRMEYFRNIYMKLIEYDGNLLRRGLFWQDEMTNIDKLTAGHTDNQVGLFPDLTHKHRIRKKGPLVFRL